MDLYKVAIKVPGEFSRLGNKKPSPDQYKIRILKMGGIYEGKGTYVFLASDS